MSRTAARVAVLLLCLGAGLAAWVPEARADGSYNTAILDRQSGLPDRKRVRARVLTTPASGRGGGYGWVRVELINPTDKPRVIDMSLSPAWSRRDRAAWTRRARVEPGKRVTLDLPRPSTRGQCQLSFRLNGRAAPETASIPNVSGGSGRRSWNQYVALVLAPPGTTLDPLVPQLTTRASTVVDSGRNIHFLPRTPDLLPRSWTLLSGFDLVIVREGLPLDEEQQAVLAQYVAGGGNLVFHPMGEGPLAALAASKEARELDSPDGDLSGRHGLGRWLQLRPGAPFLLADALWDEWMVGSGPYGFGPLAGGSRERGGSVPDRLWFPLAIPGLGEVPTGLFFFLIFGFALVVGPVNYIYFRRKHRLPMLLVTIPLLGFLCTAVIIGYGFLSEGLGVVGAERSFTVLDQDSHRAAAIRGSTLYAGLQPSSLQPRLESFAESSAFFAEADSSDTEARLAVDLDAGHRMSGTLLAPRTPTPFIAATVGTSRERLRFRRLDEGGYELLAAPGLQPVAGGGRRLILRTFDGAYHVLNEGDKLGPLKGKAAEHVINTLLAPIDRMPAGTGSWVERSRWHAWINHGNKREVERRVAGTAPLGAYVRDRIGALRPGSYLARVVRDPLPEHLGLDVEFRAREHVVYGLLAKEDLLDE